MSGSQMNSFRDEEIVFGMVTGYPWWPGFISEKKGKKHYVITFFGDFSYAPLPEKNIKKFKDGIAKIDKNNDELRDAIESAQRVLNNETTIEQEHSKIIRNSKKHSRNKIQNKKNKKISKKNTKKNMLNTSLPEQKIRDQIRQRKKKSNDKSIFKNKSMMYDNDEDNASLPEKILEEETIKEVKSPKKSISVKDNKRRKNGDRKSKTPIKKDIDKNKKKETHNKMADKKKIIEETNEQEEIELIKEEVDNNKAKSVHEEKELDVKKQNDKNNIDIAWEESEQKSSKEEDLNISNKIQEEESANLINSDDKIKEMDEISSIKKEDEEELKLDSLSQEKENLIQCEPDKNYSNEPFLYFEESINLIYSKMQKEESVTLIETNLKDWMNEITKIDKFSEIIKTNIGKTLTQMRNICIQRINQKQIYLNIFSEIEGLKKLIMSKITQNFFTRDLGFEYRDEINSTVTMKRNEKGDVNNKPCQLTPSFGQKVSDIIRKRISKKISKKISKIKSNINISRNVALQLGNLIESTIEEYSKSESYYKYYVVKFLSMIDSNSLEFVKKYILQQNNKCDFLILEERVKTFLQCCERPEQY